MKLLELLIQANVQWPDGALWAVQDFNKNIKFTETLNPPSSREGGVWIRYGMLNFRAVNANVLTDDWATKAVSKAEYDDAVAAAKAERKPVPPRHPIVVTASVLPWYKLLAPIIAAAAEGKVVQYLAADGNWYDGSGAFIHPNAYRIKPEEPKTIKVNGFDVPEPMRLAPTDGADYWVCNTTDLSWCREYTWDGCGFDYRGLRRGIVHSTKEAAVAHTKAMLGIDPYATEDTDDEHA